MADRYAVADLATALVEKRHPTVTLWNRVEGRPRTVNFERALRCEVRDALWMLTRQWQAGELTGEDRGSPVSVRVHAASSRLTRFRPDNGPAQEFDERIPLEAQVERQPISSTIGEEKVGLDLRLLMGKRWLKLIAPIADYKAFFVAKYPIPLPDPTSRQQAAVCAHADVLQSFAAAAQRAMDGLAFLEYITGAPGRHAYDGVPVLDAHRQALDAAAEAFVAWIDRLFTRPGMANPAWRAARLEHRFSCAALVDGVEKTYTADEYYQGRLDWYSLVVDPGATPLGAEAAPETPSTITREMMPAPLTYAGMPHARWWTMEDARTNFGDVRPDTTDLAKLLFIDFGLLYSNDWFVVPFTLRAGSIATVRGLEVKTVFGERFWIDAAGRGTDDAWQRWNLFTINVKGASAAAADMSLPILPTVPKIQEGQPIEEVLLIRDELANMVWAIERTIPAPDGRPRAGTTAAHEVRAYHERLVAAGGRAPTAQLLENDATIQYDIMSTVPEHWIPFVAVRARGNARAVELQRGAMLRIIQGDPVRPYAAIRPRTTLMRTGLDAVPPSPYFIPEEEVYRAGVRLTRSFQRTRWLDGSVFVWLGTRKTVGRGEGSSGLAFDRVVPKADD